MANHFKIPPKYDTPITNWIADGLTAAQIHTNLAKEGVSCSISAVDRVIRRLKQQYQAVAKLTLTKGIEKSASADLHIMNTVIESLFKKYNSLIDKDLPTALEVSAELNKWNARRVALSGIEKDNDNEIDIDSNREELVEQLNKVSSLNKSN